VRRTCAGRDRTISMLDSEEYWPATDEEAEARYVVECTCGSDEFAAAVGFNFYDDSPTPDIRWVGIAVRCTADGPIGYCASRKIGAGPSRHLPDAV
jgi:hypothetical protein